MPLSSRRLARRSCALVLSLAALVSAPGGSASSSEARARRLGESFSLAVGESAAIEGESLLVTFLEVKEDSRCPKNATCVWEGDATVRIALQTAAGGKRERDLHTSSKLQGEEAGAGYSVRLVALAPMPVAGRTIEQSEYRATLEVSPATDRTVGREGGFLSDLSRPDSWP